MNKYIVEISGRFSIKIEVDAVDNNIAKETALHLLYGHTEQVIHNVYFEHQDIDCIQIAKGTCRAKVDE